MPNIPARIHHSDGMVKMRLPLPDDATVADTRRAVVSGLQDKLIFSLETAEDSVRLHAGPHAEAPVPEDAAPHTELMKGRVLEAFAEVVAPAAAEEAKESTQEEGKEEQPEGAADTEATQGRESGATERQGPDTGKSDTDKEQAGGEGKEDAGATAASSSPTAAPNKEEGSGDADKESHEATVEGAEGKTGEGGAQEPSGIVEQDASMEEGAAGGIKTEEVEEKDVAMEAPKDSNGLTVSELLPITKRLPGLPPPSSVYEIKKDLKDREAMCITVKGLDFSGSADLELHEDSTVDHLRLAISQTPALGTMEDQAQGLGIPVPCQYLERSYRQFWREGYSLDPHEKELRQKYGLLMDEGNRSKPLFDVGLQRQDTVVVIDKRGRGDFERSQLRSATGSLWDIR